MGYNTDTPNHTAVDIDDMPRPDYVKMNAENLTAALQRIRGISIDEATRDIAEYYTAVFCGFLKAHRLTEDRKASVLLGKMLPYNTGINLTSSCFSKAHTYYGSSLSDSDPAASLCGTHSSRMLMEYFVYADKRMRNNIDEGLVSIWTYGFEEALEAFCEEYGVNYTSDAFCKSFIRNINKLAKEKWGSIFTF